MQARNQEGVLKSLRHFCGRHFESVVKKDSRNDFAASE